MYKTFANQHTLNSDKLVSCAFYSLLKRLKLWSVLSFCPAWTTATAYSLAVHSFSLTDCRKFRTQLHYLFVGQKTTTTTSTNKQRKNKQKLDHVQPILQSLHWLPTRSQIQYKICTLCFNVSTGTGPQYLSELLHLYTSF